MRLSARSPLGPTWGVDPLKSEVKDRPLPRRQEHTEGDGASRRLDRRTEPGAGSVPHIGHFYLSAKSGANSLSIFPKSRSFWLRRGIDSITLNLDTAIDTTPRIPKIEARLGRTPD